MTSPAADVPSSIGRHYATLETPALCVHLEALDANLALIAGTLRENGKSWRVAANHHSPDMARRAAAAGATGVAVATVSAAEVFAAAGCRDILIRNLVVGPQKLARVAELARTASPIVTIDHFVHAEQLDDACRLAGVRVRVAVEINLGSHHTGVRPGPDTQQLLRGIRSFRHIDTVGLVGDAEHVLAEEDDAESDRLLRSTMQILGESRERMERDGMRCELVTAIARGLYPQASRCPEPTEVLCGDELFGDSLYRDACGLSELQPVLGCLAAVVHRGKLERAVVDCGRTAVGAELRPPTVARIAGGPALSDARITFMTADQLQLTLGPESANLRIGDKIEIVPRSSRWTTIAHDRIYALRSGVVEAVWPIAARTCLQ